MILNDLLSFLILAEHKLKTEQASEFSYQKRFHAWMEQRRNDPDLEAVASSKKCVEEIYDFCDARNRYYREKIGRIESYLRSIRAMRESLDCIDENADGDKLEHMKAIVSSMLGSLGLSSTKGGERLKFPTHQFRDPDEAYRALEFLRDAHERGKVAEIENMDDVIEALDTIEYIERLEGILKSYNIPF